MRALSGNATHQIAVLAAIAARETPVTTPDLAGCLPIDRAQIIAATGRLVARGLVERLETGVFAVSWDGRHLLAEGGRLSSGAPARGKRLRPVYPDSLRQCAWRAMRLNARFSVPDLEQLAARGTERDASDSLRRFCHLLVTAGYLAELPARQPGSATSSNGFKVWRLVRNTGEQVPQYVAAKKAFVDRNTREVFACA